MYKVINVSLGSDFSRSPRNLDPDSSLKGSLSRKPTSDQQPLNGLLCARRQRTLRPKRHRFIISAVCCSLDLQHQPNQPK